MTPEGGGTGTAPGVLLRLGGTAVGVLLGFVTGVWEVFLSPLYIGRVPVPVAPVLAVATNLALVWFTYTITRHKGLALLPGVAWFAVLILGVTKTSEGDLAIPGNDWVGLLTLLLGAVAWGFAGYRMILPGLMPGPGTGTAGTGSRSGAASRSTASPGRSTTSSGRSAASSNRSAAGAPPIPGARPARRARRSGSRAAGAGTRRAGGDTEPGGPGT